MKIIVYIGEMMRVSRNGLTALALMAGSIAGVGHAAEIKVFEVPINDWTQQVSAEFAVNRELGRAWIDVKLTTRPHGEEPPAEQLFMKSVDGLYYDSVRKQVLYRSASGPIVCAEDAAVLWKTTLKTTGQCLLKERTEHQKVDNGFDLRDLTIAEVVFDAQGSTAAPHTVSSEAMGE